MNRKGFSILEILVAIALLGLLLLPLLSILNRGVRSEVSLNEVQIALKIAQEGMEEIINSSRHENEIKDEEKIVQVAGSRWKVLQDVIDGNEPDEPAVGTDPLEVWIKVYKEGDVSPLVELVTLKEDW